MAFVPWKDRVTATPHRYKLTEVAPDTYDLEAVPGAISEAGTPVNAESLDRLIQRDGDNIKDTVVAFTEAGARANIATGESTATLFGKVKKYFTDLKTHAFTAPSTTQGTGTTSVPCDNLLTQSSFARVYRLITDINSGFSLATTTPLEILTAMADKSVAYIDINVVNPNMPANYGTFRAYRFGAARADCEFEQKILNSTESHRWIAEARPSDTSNQFSGWKQVIDDSSAQTISAIKTYSVSPLVPTTPSGPSAAVAKSYADSLRTVYDKVIRTQAEFETLIADATWLGATSVALVGQFTLSTANNSGIKIPATVKQIHGFNGAKITVTNFEYNYSTGKKGGLWYDNLPNTAGYEIRNMEVDLNGTGTDIMAFYQCRNLSNCTGTGTGTGNGYGFSICHCLSNCTGTGTGTGNGYGFSNIDYAVNCKDGGSSTDMWGGINKNIDLDTCCKTLVTASNTALNT